jgi:hypothetical protein
MIIKNSHSMISIFFNFLDFMVESFSFTYEDSYSSKIYILKSFTAPLQANQAPNLKTIILQ